MTSILEKKTNKTMTLKLALNNQALKNCIMPFFHNHQALTQCKFVYLKDMNQTVDIILRSSQKELTKKVKNEICHMCFNYMFSLQPY